LCCVGVYMCGFCDMWVCVCECFVILGCVCVCVWVRVYVGFVMCGCV